MNFKKGLILLIQNFFIFSIFSQETTQPLPKTIVPGYFSVLKAQMEREKKEIQAEKAPEKKIEEKKVVEETPIPYAQYSAIYLSRVFDDPELNSQKIFLRSGKSKIQSIIDLIGRATDLDFVIDPDVKGTTGKLSFQNMTPGFILNYILTHNDPQLALIKDMNVWRIMLRNKAEEYIKIIESEEVCLEIFDVNYARINDKFKELLIKAWDNIVADKKSFSSMFIDSERKKIFVRTFPKYIQEFKNVLYEADKRLTQIKVDAIILFAEKDYNFVFGFDWGGIYNRLNTIRKKGKAFGFVGVGGRLTDYPEPTEPVTDAAGRVFGNLFVNPTNFAFNLVDRTINTPRTEAGPALFSFSQINLPFVFGGPDLNLRRLNAVLRAAEAEAKVKIISKPSIVTSDNEVAKILIGKSIPISATATDILSVAVQNISSLNYKDIGVSLEVRPSVTPEKDKIKLDIFLEESKIVDGNTLTNDRGVMTNPPTLALIKIHNKVTLNNGQTVVIGGISRCDQRRAANKVPFLHKLPLIGKWLFTAENQFKEDFEQYIFITPKIVD